MKNPQDCQDMSELRGLIDVIDRDLIAKLSTRMACVEKAAKLKKQNGQPAYIPDRIETVIKNVRAEASKMHVDPDLTEKLWRTIIDWAVEHETKLMEKDTQCT